MNAVERQALDRIMADFDIDTRRRWAAAPRRADTTAATSFATPLDASTMPVFFVALGGVAGSGKTTLARRLMESLRRAAAAAGAGIASASTANGDDASTTQQQLQQDDDLAVGIGSVTVLPMDGYHRYRDELRAMPDPAEAFRARGAPYTFNSAKYERDMAQLRATGRVCAPGFDHAAKDPQEGMYDVGVCATVVLRPPANADESSTSSATSAGLGGGAAPTVLVTRPVVIVEGLYTLYDGDAHWAAARALFDLHLYLRVPADVATERLTARHMRAWGIPREEAFERASGSDRDNGVLASAAADRLESAVVLNSVDDEEFV